MYLFVYIYTKKTPPKNNNLTAFENDLYAMVKTIEFTNVKSQFLNKLKNDVKEINKSEKLLVFADKTNNMYRMDKEHYEKMLHDNITKSYKKSANGILEDINNEAREIAKSLKLDEKMEAYADRRAFITLKDHKDNFSTNPKCRLLNPAKSEIGIVSKHILQRINAEIRNSTGLNQWRSTSSVISWFSNILDKKNCKFMKFDIVDFYPSITEDLFRKSFEYAKSLVEINDNEFKIIKHARKSLLFDSNDTWTKKDDDDLFDVTQGSYDGAEVCENIGLFLLHSLSNRFGKDNYGLYRDDGLAALSSCSGPQADKARKDLIKIFKDNGLNITVETNLIATDFLDVHFDLQNGIYKPFRKPNDTPLYVNAGSNHPPNIIKQLPLMIGRRISDISSNKAEFDKASREYNDALSKSGYKDKIIYQEAPKHKRNRSRNILWFNPPYSKSVKSNVGKTFMGLIEKHFPPHHKYRSLFNKNNVKVSYSSTENMENVIKRHNAKILNASKSQKTRTCNCPVKSNCPLQGSCLKKCIVYKATVTSENSKKFYYGQSEPEFKSRLANHTKSFKYRSYEKDTELSKYIWSLKDKEKPYDIAWSIAATASQYKCGTRKCDLCITEKYIIAMAEPETLLNSKSELISKCRHCNKFYLKNWKFKQKS